MTSRPCRWPGRQQHQEVATSPSAVSPPKVRIGTQAPALASPPRRARPRRAPGASRLTLNASRHPGLPMVVLTPAHQSRCAAPSPLAPPMGPPSPPPADQACALAIGRARLRDSATSNFGLPGSSPIACASMFASPGEFAAESELSRLEAPPASPASTIQAPTATPGPSHRYSDSLPRSPNMLRLPRGSCYAGSMRPRKHILELTTLHTSWN